MQLLGAKRFAQAKQERLIKEFIEALNARRPPIQEPNQAIEGLEGQREEASTEASSVSGARADSEVGRADQQRRAPRVMREYVVDQRLAAFLTHVTDPDLICFRHSIPDLNRIMAPFFVEQESIISDAYNQEPSIHDIPHDNQNYDRPLVPNPVLDLRQINSKQDFHNINQVLMKALICLVIDMLCPQIEKRRRRKSRLKISSSLDRTPRILIQRSTNRRLSRKEGKGQRSTLALKKCPSKSRRCRKRGRLTGRYTRSHLLLKANRSMRQTFLCSSTNSLKLIMSQCLRGLASTIKPTTRLSNRSRMKVTKLPMIR